MNLHFISGLPRAGSTLLVALLRQNPAFSLEAFSPVLPLVNAAFPVMSKGEFATRFTPEQRENVVRSIVEGYHAKEQGVIFDCNRMWTSKLPLIARLYPNAKVICPVRPLGEIANSFEKAIQKNPLQWPGFHRGATVAERIDHWVSRKGVIGAPFTALTEAMSGSYKDRIMLVNFDDLCIFPQHVLDMVYEFIGQPAFEHDFTNFEYHDTALDARIGSPELHDVVGPVRPPDKKVIIPKQAFDQLNTERLPRT